MTSAASYQDFFGQRPPSSIDFSTELVLNYALGLKPTGGYGVRLESVQRWGRSLRIGVTSIAPSPSCALPPVSVHPDVTAKVKATRLSGHALRVVLSPLVACPSDQALCEASAGKWDSPGCKGDACTCGAGNAFVASAGGCVSSDDAKAACVASRGAWGPSAPAGGGLCTCPTTMRFVRRYGRCAWDEDLCVDSGGAWRDDDANAQGLYCDCHAPKMWIPDHGGCVEG